MNTIEKTIKSKVPPSNTNVLWIDTSVTPSILKAFEKGEWVNLGAPTEDDTNESTDNKVKVITSSSTHEQYPSAKAVYTYVSNQVGTIAAALNEIIYNQ